MTHKITLDAPAKVNLSLDVLRSRLDGFHDLDSIVVPFSPTDSLALSVTLGSASEKPIELVCSDPRLPTGAGNLAHRAAAAFASRVLAAQAAHIFIELEKHVPHEAGLGGGSSDAASVLLALAAIFKTDMKTLSEVAATVGSDVPLFLERAPVRISGRGEVVEKLKVPIPKLFGVLVKPDIGVPTPKAYALLDALPRRESAATPRLMALLEANANLDELAAALHNDFEAAILPAFPEIADAYAKVLAAGALRALLCGSGSAIFGLARDRDDAARMASKLAGHFPYVQVAESYDWPAYAE